MSSAIIKKGVLGSEMMNQAEVKIYVLKSVMNKMIANNIRFPKKLTDEYKNIPLCTHSKNLVYKSMKKLNKKNEDLINLIGIKYNEYKYVGDETTAPVMNFNGDILTHEEIVEFMGYKQKAKAFFWNFCVKKLAWLDTEGIEQQFKVFKQARKGGLIKCMEHNNVEHEFNGLTWYSLVIQFVDEDENPPMDVGAVAIFRFLVSGWAYHFTKKTNRDAMFAYLNK